MMTFKKNNLITISILLISISVTNCYSQSKSGIGLNFLFDKTTNSNFRVVPGISLDIKIGKHLGVSLEIGYRTYIDNSFIDTISLPPNNAGIVYFTMKQKFLTIPLMLKYYSKIVNLSFGPAADFYLGIHEEKYNTNPPGLYIPAQTSYKFDNSILWGLKLEVSKDFNLINKIRVEPGLYYNPIFTSYSLYSGHYINKRQYFGGTIAIKLLL